MTFLKALFLLAVSQSVVWGQSPEKKSPWTYLRIVNATSVPAISLSVNERMLYPQFRQGEKTSPGTFDYLSGTVEVKNLADGTAASEKFKFEPEAAQSLIILGDFKMPETPAPETSGPKATGKKRPNVTFLVVSHELAGDEKPYRYRIVNGLIGESLTCSVRGEEDVIAAPGGTATFAGKGLVCTIQVKTEKDEMPLRIHQEMPYHNVTCVFYRKQDGLAYVVIPEEDAAYYKKLPKDEEEPAPAAPPE